jgi:uncharacterized protein YjiK
VRGANRTRSSCRRKRASRIKLPKEARFKDYSSLAYRKHQIAVASQESARVWVGRLDAERRGLVPGSGRLFRFPGKHYRNIEGIDWLSDDTFVAVSDRMKKNQSGKCARTDQSIHVFRIPQGQ